MAPASSDTDLKAWLTVQTRNAGLWPTLAWVAGAAGLVAVVGQAFVLAAFFQGWIFDHRSFSELQVWWWALPPLLVVRAAASWVKDEAGARGSRAVRQALRTSVIDRIRVLGSAWKTGQPSGAVASRVLEQIDGLDAYVARYLPQQKLAMIGPVLILLFVFPLNWICGLLLLLTAPLIPLFMILIGMGAQAVQSRQLRSLSRMSGSFLDILRGLTTLKLLGAHGRQTGRVAAVSEEFRVRTMMVLRLAFLSSTMLEFFSVLAIALTALYLGFTLLGHINFGLPLTFQTALFVLLLAPDFYQPLRDLGTLYHARGEALASAGQLKPLFDTPSPSPSGGNVVPKTTPPALRLVGLSFAHRPGVPILRNLDLAVASGETLAFVGPSGVGKTTLLRLLQGELTPESGAILVDGTPLGTLNLDLWRGQIGWMGQHPRLLSATLGDNLRVADGTASDAGLVDALEFAGLGAWFGELSDGLRTMLGEGGRPLSGGQVRRLALARLKLRNAPLLLLDEPTASLDDETQDQVLDSLARLKPGRTMILVTHHQKPLVLADRTWALAPLHQEEDVWVPV